jgi:hypothetical protein
MSVQTGNPFSNCIGSFGMSAIQHPDGVSPSPRKISNGRRLSHHRRNVASSIAVESTAYKTRFAKQGEGADSLH